MTRNWAEMTREEFGPPEPEYGPVDERAVEGDITQILYDHMYDHWEPLRLDGQDWRMAAYEDNIPDDTDLVICRESDGLMLAVEITVSVSPYQPAEEPAGL